MSDEAHADIRDRDGRIVARATAEERPGTSVRVRIVASGLAAGTYGTHIHMVGRCDPPGFESAGAHLNPEGKQHGMLNQRGSHLGDIRNLEVGDDGTGTQEHLYLVTRLRGYEEGQVDGVGRRAMIDADGVALVIHANPDDYRTDPTGNSGARIACGVLN